MSEAAASRLVSRESDSLPFCSFNHRIISMRGNLATHPSLNYQTISENRRNSIDISHLA
jgi:hypothetical protein